MPEPHDFAEHGRLLAERARCCRVVEDAGHFDNYTDAHRARCRIAEIDEAVRKSIDAYRAVVEEADYFIKTGSGEAKVRLRAALAAFKNIGGAP